VEHRALLEEVLRTPAFISCPAGVAANAANSTRP